MNLDTIRSFLHVAESGSFSVAATWMGVMQSTISGRIQALEEELGCILFNRGRTGAELTAQGREFRAYAEKMVQAWDQARQQIALPAGHTGIFRFGGPVAIHDRLIIAWTLWMKETLPGIALQIEASSSDALTEGLSSGLLDAALMYLPRQRPGLAVRELLREDLVLVQHAQAPGRWQDHFVFIDWGPEFRAGFGQAFPGSPPRAISVGLGALGLQYVLALKGAAYLPAGAVETLVAERRLHRVAGAPVYNRPVYLVHPVRGRDPELLDTAIEGLRRQARALGLSEPGAQSDIRSRAAKESR